MKEKPTESACQLSYLKGYNFDFQLFETRSKYVKEGEAALWSDVTQEVMSDEEDLDGGLKIKTPHWRSKELGALIEKLDERHIMRQQDNNRQVLRKRRVATASPMKRKPSKKLKQHLLKD